MWRPTWNAAATGKVGVGWELAGLPDTFEIWLEEFDGGHRPGI